MGGAREYPVVEIFESLQGEGFQAGREAVFLRFGGCNLACAWCDTAHQGFTRLPEEAVVARVTACRARSLIVTGGEPFLQRELGVLLARFQALGYWIGVETNGVEAPPPAWRRLIDYLAVSPKAGYAERYAEDRMVRQADEVRVVVDGDAAAFCREMRRRIRARRYYLTPCEREGRWNVEETLRLLATLNGEPDGDWLLSFQAHKLAGLR